MRLFTQSAKVLSLAACLLSSNVYAGPGVMNYFSYAWMNAVVNKTPVIPAACPEINTDIYGAGFKVALEKNFYGLLGITGSHWFPKSEIWASVGVAPVINSFGIMFTDIDKIEELDEVKARKLPTNIEELNNWKVSDSAYWESQGGIALYLGAGIFPVNAGVFAVASGGWGHYLQKTGPNKVYVELAKTNIKSISLGVGVGRPNINIQEAWEKSKGFSYEFVLDNQEAIEAYERFMAGDMTKAQELSKVENSGVNKIADLFDAKTTFSKNIFINTPFVALLSFRASSESTYNHNEEKTVWDENVLKDMGIFVKRREHSILNKRLRESRSFTGGKITSEAPGQEGAVHSEKLYGNFKYLYQSNWGQERRLRKYISKVRSLTGLTQETCARVPAFKDTLGFNQVSLEMNWADEYIKEIIGVANLAEGQLLAQIEKDALKYYSEKVNSPKCVAYSEASDDQNDPENYDEMCTVSSSSEIRGIFASLRSYAKSMHSHYNGDKKDFAKNMAKFGKLVWSSPFVFKAFYEKGKVCGQDFKYEVSGRRITRHAIDQKFFYSEECTGTN